ncbi:AMP-binding protein [Protofrankia symbiont of Coriaria ruscifolia]|nr:AMP-binding protein [Protofrankia symbiont of Coriaria ruscifolia]
MPGGSTTKREIARTETAAYADRPWQSSYAEGVPTEVEISDITLGQLFENAVTRFPLAPATSFFGTTLTYDQLREQVDAFAGGLAKLGVGAGDRVALILPNCPQHVIAFYAVLRLGAIVAEANPLYTEAELTHQLSDCGAEYVVCLDRTYAVVEAARRSGRTRVREVIYTSIPDFLPRKDQLLLRLPIAKARRKRAEIVTDLPAGARAHAFLDVYRTGRADPVRTSVQGTASDVAVLLYTTGTTGPAKGAMLTHRNLVANAVQCRAWFTDAQIGREVVLAVLPMFHAYGMTLCMTVGMLIGAHVVLIPKFDVTMLLDAIVRHRPTTFPGVPPIYRALLDDPRAKSVDLTSIRGCLSGAMKLPGELQQRWEGATGTPVVEGYGMTEASPVTHAGPLGKELRPGWIGLPLPSTEAKIVELEDHSKEVPVGEPGELLVRGPQVFAGYWENPDSTKAVLTDDGWLLTGDVARMDTAGWFEIVDRKKELIIAGGFNISPNEIEDVLSGIPEVAEVAVIGVPDAYRGETVKAFLVLRPGESLTVDEVRAYCSERLSAYKVPKIIEFRTESLPKIGIGKVLRRALRDEEKAKAERQAAGERDAAGS